MLVRPISISDEMVMATPPKDHLEGMNLFTPEMGDAFIKKVQLEGMVLNKFMGVDPAKKGGDETHTLNYSVQHKAKSWVEETTYEAGYLPPISQMVVVATKKAVVEGIPFEVMFEGGMAKEAYDDEVCLGNWKEDVESELMKLIREKQVHSISCLVDDMANNKQLGQYSNQLQVEAMFSAIKHDLLGEINNKSDVDLEKQLEEVGCYIIAALMKRCRKVSSDKDIAHMKHRMILDVEFDYGDVEPWL